MDAAKDQSYVLAVLTSEQLARAMFPLGGSTKDEVRKEAADRGLAVATKPDSHDVCFIADGDTRKFLTSQLGAVPGCIVEADGTEVGRHDGAFGFTVASAGPRASAPGSRRRPRYVLERGRSPAMVGGPPNPGCGRHEARGRSGQAAAGARQAARLPGSAARR